MGGTQFIAETLGSPSNYTHDALDKLMSAGSVTYDYDARGNLWHRTNGSQVTTYTYDADGWRVKQTIGSAVTSCLWDEASRYGDVVYEYNGSGATLASYVLGGTQLISQTQ